MRLALAGGGTGGHIVPGCHLLAHAEVAAAVADLVWFQSGRAVEERVLAAAEGTMAALEWERVVLRLEPPGGGAPSLARLAREMLPATRAARRALRAHRSEVLLGLGGFTCVPAVLAARSLRLPVAMLEINVVAGRATRWLAPIVQRVLHAWPDGTRGMGGVGEGTDPGAAKHRFVGAPLAPEYAAAPPTRAQRGEARRREGFDPERELLVVLGGSQGARGLNEFVRAHVAGWLEAGVQVLHQVGPGRAKEADPARPGYQPREYVDDVPRALTAASWVLCRGGASTLAEVGARAVPMWIVPYPHHADAHQELNARQLFGEGVRVVPERDLGPERASELARLAGPEGRADREALRAELAGRVPGDGALRCWAEVAGLLPD